MNPARHDDPATLLPWYVNGTLEAAERGQVEAWLRDAPEHEAELAMWRAVQVDARNAAPVPAFDELGWRRLRTQLPAARRTTWLKVAAAASVMLIAGLQTAILVRDESGVHRPLGESSVGDQWRFHARFTPSATLEQIGAMLDRHDAQLVGGPSALGLYTIAIAKQQALTPEALIAALEAEPLIEEVTVSP